MNTIKITRICLEDASIPLKYTLPLLLLSELIITKETIADRNCFATLYVY
jgi:hypothetical protein